ncbi:POK10 protein, partial [Aramus guarauna]|nr:POK10 protein [Aramus guarauna]
LTKGNAVADQLSKTAVLPHHIEQARLTHEFFHQNAQSLRKQFSLTLAQAQEIVRACPDCQRLALLPTSRGTNLRGLASNDLWQTDVTHCNPFGHFKYVHVSVHTFSGFLVATAH